MLCIGNDVPGVVNRWIFDQKLYLRNIYARKTNMKNLQRNLQSALVVCILTVGGSQSGFSQSDNIKIASFMILVETTTEGFKLACEKGCAWKELSFSLQPYKPQAIDQWGMTSPEKHRTTKNASLGNFLFTIEKTDKDGVSLESMEGTAWKKLGFRGSGHRSREYINAYGTVKPEK